MLIYAVYALFLVFALTSFGDLIGQGFANAPPPSGNWVAGGITYASYNIVGAVIILPVLRHLTSQRDAVIAGVIAGPLTMLPAILFFVAMKIGRASCREECVSTCRYRWSPYH